MKGKFQRAADIVRRCIEAALQPRPVQRVWEWIDLHVWIPMIVGSTNPGPLDTMKVPPMRGLWDLYWDPRVHYFTLCKSARVGGTLFAICCVLHKIATWPGPILWVDPTRKSATRFSRGELQPHIMECAATAALAIITKTTWTTLEMFFRACTLGLVGAGSAVDLGGRQAEMVVLNERDKFGQHLKAEAPPAELARARTKQFRHTRKILENSTPTVESGDTWQQFLAGSQHYCYLPCPHCHTKQRLTFFSEEKEVPFDEKGNPLPHGEKRIEKTGRVKFDHGKRPGRDDYDLDRVENESTYECAHCQKDILHTSLNWMMRRYEWRAHNAAAPADTISAHFWAAYSPFESWGQLAKKFLRSRGSVAKMHDFFNSDLGLPFVRHATDIKDSDIDVVIRRSPEYLMGQLPLEPIMLTMTVDVQGHGYWWSIRAWGLIEDHPDMPMWNALIDCGEAVSWDQIEEIAGIKVQDNGKYNRYVFTRPDGQRMEFQVAAGLVDSGFEAQQGKKVYDFCLRNADVFSPSKGGSRQQLRGKFVTETLVADDKLKLVWYWDDHLKQSLYYFNIKEGKARWWLPRDVPACYRAQLTAERTVEKKLANGTVALEWVVEGPEGNHLGDTEKLHEVMREPIEVKLEEIREELMAAVVLAA